MRIPKPVLVVAFCAQLLSHPALARLPDPVQFGAAVEAGNLSAAAEWLEQGLEPDFLADRIGSGLMLGAWEGNIPMMELFLQHGANINATNRQGEQALQLAAWTNHLDAVTWLLDHGAAINRGGGTWSALHYAVFAGNDDVARLLIRRGAEINATAPNGSTVLMMAAHEGQEKLARMLLDAGANPAIKNDQGESALTWAMRYGNFTIAELVSGREQLAAAARAPSQSWGSATRSVAAPRDIGELLRRIRILEVSGQATGKTRKELYAAIEDFKKGSRRETLADPTLPPRVLVITAKRNKPGQEKAELIPDRTAMPAAPRSRVADILYRLRRAETEGKPTEAIRQELIEAISNMQE